MAQSELSTHDLLTHDLLTHDLPQAAAALPTVSVIVPIYNGERDLAGLIDCLLKQTYPIDRVEYLLVDNGSGDRTPELIQTAVIQAKSQGITVRGLQETDIQSAYAARNTAIRQATGEVLAFTDADCYPQPDWLAKLIQGFTDDTIGLVVGEVTAFPGKTWLERYAERKRLMSQKDTLAHPFCGYGQTANLAIRASALKEIGLFRPRMTTGGDADICWRLQREGGWQLVFAESAVVQHHHRTTFQDLRAQWYRYGRSNRYLHQLYGVKLARPLRPKEIRHTLTRWLLKEVPVTCFNLLRGRADLLDFAMTPISLYCSQARHQGQANANLPEEAREIAVFTENPT
ncbi:MAG: glycosyltransferase [Phormidesmis sp. RL_2_1]|nr:glycosyltransferase [Phormidesmis sp. RL_2_1]